MNLRGSIVPTILTVSLIGPPAALAANTAPISAEELVRAINKAEVQSVPYRVGELKTFDIHLVRCIMPNEEPTESKCSWRQKGKNGWVRRQTWLAIDGAQGWRVIE